VSNTGLKPRTVSPGAGQGDQVGGNAHLVARQENLTAAPDCPRTRGSFARWSGEAVWMGDWLMRCVWARGAPARQTTWRLWQRDAEGGMEESPHSCSLGLYLPSRAPVVLV
jgi:hypothetical protein